MKIISKIKAFFNFKGQRNEMELSAAEVRKDKIFLHPTDDPKHTFCMKFKEVGIIIDPDEEISEEDILVIDTEKIKTENKTLETQEKENENEKDIVIRPIALKKFMPKKKRFTVMVYPDEYDMLMDNIVSNGYKKAEFLLACVTASKKQSWESEYKHFTSFHQTRRKTDIAQARRAQEEDFFNRKKQAEDKLKEKDKTQ